MSSSFNWDEYINFSDREEEKRRKLAEGVAVWIAEQLELLGFSEKQISDDPMLEEIVKEAEKIAEEIDPEDLEVAAALVKTIDFNGFDTLVRILPLVNYEFLDKLHMLVMKAVGKIAEKFEVS